MLRNARAPAGGVIWRRTMIRASVTGSPRASRMRPVITAPFWSCRSNTTGWPVAFSVGPWPMSPIDE
jgi:hypothetical protein